MNYSLEHTRFQWRTRIAATAIVGGFVIFFLGFIVYLPVFELTSFLGLGKTILLNIAISVSGLVINIAGSLLDVRTEAMVMNYFAASSVGDADDETSKKGAE